MKMLEGMNELKLDIRLKRASKETLAKQLLVLQRLADLDLKYVRVCKKYHV